MANELVERLRKAFENELGSSGVFLLCTEAANKIERLEAALSRIAHENPPREIEIDEEYMWARAIAKEALGEDNGTIP